jgi:hypothetical protein
MTPDLATAALTRRAVATIITTSSAKPVKRVLGRHDADHDRRKQGEHRDDVVSKPPPYKEGHHDADDREGGALALPSCSAKLKRHPVPQCGWQHRHRRAPDNVSRR